MDKAMSGSVTAAPSESHAQEGPPAHSSSSFTEWLTTTFSPCTKRPDVVEAGFGEWLAERLDAERKVMVAEVEAQWQYKHQNLHGEIMEAFCQSLRANADMKPSQGGPLTPPVPLPRPNCDPETPPAKVPLVQGSPVTITQIPVRTTRPRCRSKTAPQGTPPHSNKVQGSPVTFHIVDVPETPTAIVKGSPVSTVKDSPAPTAEAVRPSPALSKDTPLTKNVTDHDTPLTVETQTTVKSGLSSTMSLERGCDAHRWHRFEVFFGMVILLNALVMLVEEQYRGLDTGFALGVKGYGQSARDLFPAAEGTFTALNVLFNLMYTVELLCQLVHAKSRFYRSVWIWIDLIVVPLAWCDIFQVFGEVSSVPPTMVRLFRVVRLFHLIQVMESFEKLNLLIRSIKASFSALTWSMVVILFTQVISALWLHHTLSSFYQDDSQPEAARREVFDRFGTASRSLLTMFQVVFSNWSQPCWMLVLNVSEWYGVFFVLYRCVLGFALIKVVSSMFIAETHRLCAHDKEMESLKKRRDSEIHKAQLRKLFGEVDKSGDGNVSRHELQVMLESKKLVQYVEKLGINPLHLQHLFAILEIDGEDGQEGYVKLEDFVAGVLKVGGSATAIDVFAVSKAVDRLSAKMCATDVEDHSPFESLYVGY